MDAFLEQFSWIHHVATGIWMALTFLMIWVLINIYSLTGASNKYFYWGVFLMIVVWLYPYITSSTSLLELVLAGNLLVMGVTLVHLRWLREVSIRLSRLMIPQLLWITTLTVHSGLPLIEKYLI